MPKFVLFFSFTAQTVSTMIQSDAQPFVDSLVKTLTAAGGSLEKYYWMRGKLDALAIASAPTDMDVNAVSLALASTGQYSHVETHELVDPTDFVTLLAEARRLTLAS